MRKSPFSWGARGEANMAGIDRLQEGATEGFRGWGEMRRMDSALVGRELGRIKTEDSARERNV
jgi:hypothetical protein